MRRRHPGGGGAQAPRSIRRQRRWQAANRGSPEPDLMRKVGPCLGAAAGLSPPSHFAGASYCSQPSQQSGVRLPGRLAGVLLREVEAPAWRRLSYPAQGDLLDCPGSANRRTTFRQRPQDRAARTRAGQDEQQSASTGKHCFASVWHALVIERERLARRTWRRLRTWEYAPSRAGTMSMVPCVSFARSMRQGISNPAPFQSLCDCCKVIPRHELQHHLARATVRAQFSDPSVLC